MIKISAFIVKETKSVRLALKAFLRTECSHVPTHWAAASAEYFKSVEVNTVVAVSEPLNDLIG